jgi:hypothetical protein
VYFRDTKTQLYLYIIAIDLELHTRNKIGMKNDSNVSAIVVSAEDMGGAAAAGALVEGAAATGAMIEGAGTLVEVAAAAGALVEGAFKVSQSPCKTILLKINSVLPSAGLNPTAVQSFKN